MKKLFSLLSLLLCLALLLCACKEQPTPTPDAPPEPPAEQTPEEPVPEKTFAEMGEVEKAFYLLCSEPLSDGEVESYQTDTTLSVSGTYSGLSMTAEGSETTQFHHPKSSGLVFSHTAAQTRLTVTGGGQSHTVTQRGAEGFVDGKMFSSYSDTDGESYARYCTLTPREYLSYRKQINEEDAQKSIKASDCTTVTCVEKDGGYEATFSGLTQGGLQKLRALWWDFAEMAETAAPEALTLKLSVDGALLPRWASLEITFPELVVSSRITYSAYNETEPFAVDLSEYSPIGDLRAIGLINKTFSALEQASALSFDYTARIEAELPDQNAVSDVKGSLSLKNQNGAYSFEMNERLDGTPYLTTYKNGVITQTVGTGAPITQNATLREAAAVLAPYVKPITLDAGKVLYGTDVLSDGSYYAQIKEPDLTVLQPIIDAYGVDEAYVNPSAILQITVDADGNVTGMDYSITVRIWVEALSKSYNVSYHLVCESYNMTK